MNTKLHAVSDARGRPIGFFMSAGQVSDYTGAAALLGSLPNAGWLLADRGYDADWFREALKDKGIKVCIPRPEISQEGGEIRQEALQTAQPHRDHVRPPKRLATGCHPIRSMPGNVPLRHHPRRHCLVLAMIKNES
jgi:transposase